MDFDPSKAWDRYCQQEEDNIHFQAICKLADILKNDGHAVTINDIGRKVHLTIDGVEVNVPFSYNQEGEIDVAQMAGEAMQLYRNSPPRDDPYMRVHFILNDDPDKA